MAQLHTPKFPKFSQIDTYIIRNEIDHFLKSKSEALKGEMLDIGCGQMPYKEWIINDTAVSNYTGLDIDNPIYNDETFRPDIVWDGITMPSDDNQFDSAILLEVLEHCEQPELVIKEALRVLKPGGKLLFSVPFIWYYHDVPYDFSRYTYFKLKAMFEKSGFEVNEISGYGNWNSFLAHCWAMWVKRNSLPKIVRFGFYLLGLPFYALLYRKNKGQSSFKSLDIAIGHYGVVTKPLT
jgi:SAM-dependent methyltransferase